MEKVEWKTNGVAKEAIKIEAEYGILNTGMDVINDAVKKIYDLGQEPVGIIGSRTDISGLARRNADTMHEAVGEQKGPSIGVVGDARVTLVRDDRCVKAVYITYQPAPKVWSEDFGNLMQLP